MTIQEILCQIDKETKNYNLYLRMMLQDKKEAIIDLLDDNQIEAAKDKINELLKWMDTFPAFVHFPSFHEVAA